MQNFRLSLFVDGIGSFFREFTHEIYLVECKVSNEALSGWCV